MITLGLNNGETVGQRMDAAPHPLNAGMINIVATISVRLTDAGLLEVSSIITLARTASLPHFGYRRPAMEEIDIGTGTDCIVAAAPVADDPARFPSGERGRVQHLARRTMSRKQAGDLPTCSTSHADSGSWSPTKWD